MKRLALGTVSNHVLQTGSCAVLSPSGLEQAHNAKGLKAATSYSIGSPCMVMSTCPRVLMVGDTNQAGRRTGL